MDRRTPDEDDDTLGWSFTSNEHSSWLKADEQLRELLRKTTRWKPVMNRIFIRTSAPRSTGEETLADWDPVRETSNPDTRPRRAAERRVGALRGTSSTMAPNVGPKIASL